MRTNLQPFIFGFIVSLIGSGGFVYLLATCNGFELAMCAVGLVVAVVCFVGCGLTIEQEILDRIKAKKAKD